MKVRIPGLKWRREAYMGIGISSLDEDVEKMTAEGWNIYAVFPEHHWRYHGGTIVHETTIHVFANRFEGDDEDA